MEGRPKITVSVKNSSQSQQLINLFDSEYCQQGVDIGYTVDDQAVQDQKTLFKNRTHISLTRIYFINCPEGFTEKQITGQLDWDVKTTKVAGPDKGKVATVRLSFWPRRINPENNTSENNRFYCIGRNAIASFKLPANTELKIDLYYLKRSEASKDLSKTGNATLIIP